MFWTIFLVLMAIAGIGVILFARDGGQAVGIIMLLLSIVALIFYRNHRGDRIDYAEMYNKKCNTDFTPDQLDALKRDYIIALDSDCVDLIKKTPSKNAENENFFCKLERKNFK